MIQKRELSLEQARSISQREPPPVNSGSTGILQEIAQNIKRVILGKDRVIDYCLVGLLSEGHILLEDVPGVGKTMLVRALAVSLNTSYRRVQFTPDLMPSDLTGVSIYNPRSREFEFRPGSIMGNIILADEINRTSPRTQAALLEAMEEHSVSVDGQTYSLPRPFLVLATQNPIEYEGTFPLPETQLDRFSLQLNLGYPSRLEEVEILQRLQFEHPIAHLSPVASPELLGQLQHEVRQVYIDPSLQDYIVRLVQATRQYHGVYLGASPRGAIALQRTTQSLAFLRGRTYVLPDDIKEMAAIVLAHRLLLTPEARDEGLTSGSIIAELLRQVSIPIMGRIG